MNLFKNIRETNLFTLLISAASIAFLMIIKFCAEPLLKQYIDLKIPIPSELILVNVCHFLNQINYHFIAFKQIWNV